MTRIFTISIVIIFLVTLSIGCIQHYRQPTFKDGKKITILNPQDVVVAELTDKAQVKRITKTFREAEIISSDFSKKPATPKNNQEWLMTKVYKVKFYNKESSDPEVVALDNDFTMFWFGPFYYKPSKELKQELNPYINKDRFNTITPK